MRGEGGGEKREAKGGGWEGEGEEVGKGLVSSLFMIGSFIIPTLQYMLASYKCTQSYYLLFTCASTCI